LYRKKALSYIESLFSKDDDVLFYVGKYLVSETASFSAVKILSDIDCFSIVFGLSMVLDKRFIIICEDVFMLRYLNSVVQLGAGNCKNIVILCLVTGVYVVGCNQPTIFNTVNSLKGIFLNAGFLVHNYDNFFRNKTELNNLAKRMSTVEGPLVGLITVSNEKLFNVGKIEDNFKEFIGNIEVVSG